ncbi:MAG: CocE/NonD family hydrolase [Acidimicrobiales bacterium]|nr:CocE/NonD family hydrolase [Acidimicrobiales bacterium]
MRIRHEVGLVATMADGVALVADAWYPEEGAPFPVLLQRLPYGRAVASAPVFPPPVQLARRGYAVVVQDVRGRGDSEGEFEPFVNEGCDGAATVEWAAGLPFSDGNVVTYGFSYQGLAQIAAAAHRPNGLRAIAPMMCATEPYEMLYEGECLLWEASARWAAQLATGERDDERVEANLERKPLDAALGDRSPAWFGRWTREDSPDAPYWRRCAPDLSAVEVPVFTVVGYADTFAAATSRLIRRLGAEAVVGPWAHMPWGTRLGDLELRDANPTVAIEAFLSFVDGVLGRAPRPAPETRYYTVGAGWRQAPGFPPPGRNLVLHARSVVGANSRHGDGELCPWPAPERLDDVIVSEPLAPYPGSPSPYPDVAAAEDRRDVLCYTTPPLDSACELVGSPRVVARLSSDVECFDVMATLSIVTEAASRRLCVGAGRLQTTPGCELQATIDLGPIAWRLEVATRLRLDVSASLAPLFATNPQTGRPIPATARRGEHRVATIELTAATLSVSLAEDGG